MLVRMLLFLAFSLLCNIVVGQSLTKQDLRELHTSIGIYLVKQEKLIGLPQRNSEYFVSLIEIDDSGYVRKFTLLSDDKNKGLTHEFLVKMPLEVFKKFRPIGCKGKTIVMPILSIGKRDNPSYISALEKIHIPRQSAVIWEKDGIVYMDALIYRTLVFESKENVQYNKNKSN